MNLERAAMKGRLAEAKHEYLDKTNKAKGLCDSIKMQLNYDLTTIEDMEMAITVQVFDELAQTYAEILGLKTKIERLEKELR